MKPDAWDQLVVVGQIVRPHGRHGEVVVAPDTDFVDERYRPGQVFAVRRDTWQGRLTVTRWRPMSDGRLVVLFEGIGSIDEAERWRDAELRIDEADLMPLDENSWWIHELVGCQVVTVEGHEVGPVTAVTQPAGQHLLHVTVESGEVLIPLVKAICVTVDVEHRRIEIDPPAGLLDMNVSDRQA